jgi:hypothetical protein
MKRKISKEEFEKLSDALKENYKEKNGSYLLNIEDDDDAIVELRQARDHEKEDHRNTKLKMKELETKLDELTNGKHKLDGNIEALEKSWKEKFENREKELLGEVGKLKGMLSGSVKETTLTALASKFVKPDFQRFFKKDIETRFEVELEGDKPTLRILGKDGKPSALSLEDFEKEILANKEYGSILIASRASGAGGTDKPKPAGGTVHADSEGKPLNLATMSPIRLAEHLAASKTTE